MASKSRKARDLLLGLVQWSAESKYTGGQVRDMNEQQLIHAAIQSEFIWSEEERQWVEKG